MLKPVAYNPGERVRPNHSLVTWATRRGPPPSPPPQGMLESGMTGTSRVPDVERRGGPMMPRSRPAKGLRRDTMVRIGCHHGGALAGYLWGDGSSRITVVMYRAWPNGHRTMGDSTGSPRLPQPPSEYLAQFSLHGIHVTRRTRRVPPVSLPERVQDLHRGLPRHLADLCLAKR